MKNFILNQKIFYRLYQKLIRKDKNEYDFIKYIFKKYKNKNIKLLDICCGDSYILNYIKPYLSNYTGIDNNPNYLKNSKEKHKKFNFIKSNIEEIHTLKIIKKSKINFIFLNGAIHHLNNKTVKELILFLKKNFPRAIFLSIDPLNNNNKFINKIMIKLDRGEYIRTKKMYSKIMGQKKILITKNFFIMEFLLIFHYSNINLKKIFNEWKNLL